VAERTDRVVIRLRGAGRERLRFLPRVLDSAPVAVGPPLTQPLRLVLVDTADGLLRRAGVAMGVECVGERAAAFLELLSGGGPPASEFPLREEIAPLGARPEEALRTSAVARGVAALIGPTLPDVSVILAGERAEYPVAGGAGRLVIDALKPPDAPEDAVVVEATLSGGGEVAALAERLAEKLDLASARTHRALAAFAVAGGPPASKRSGGFGLRREDRFIDAAFRVLRACFGRMRWNEPGTRLGLEPECLHDMRVATRRLRAALKLFAPALPLARTAAFEKRLRWLAGALGTVRDLDVHLEHFDAEAALVTAQSRPALEPYRDLLLRRRARARREMLRALSAQRYARFVEAMERFLAAGPPRRPRVAVARRPAAEAAVEVIRERLDHVLQSTADLAPDAPDAELHQLRIRCKRLRYACECFAGLYRKPVARFARRVARLQEALGEHQDAVTACATLTALSRSPPPRGHAREFALALGQLTQWHAQRAAAARQLFFRRWKKFTRKKVRKALMAALRTDGESRRLRTEH
jgi:CHAD domain-containing protein